MHECIITGKVVGMTVCTDWNGKQRDEMARLQIQIDGQGTDTIIQRDIPTTMLPQNYWQQRFEITAAMTARRAEKGGAVYERVGDVTNIKPAKVETAKTSATPAPVIAKA